MARTSVESALVPCASWTIVAVPGLAAAAASRESAGASERAVGADGSAQAASASAPMARLTRTVGVHICFSIGGT